MASWKRPDSVPYPSIWRTFEGKQEINGIKPKYWVQDLTPEYKEEYLHIMKTGFLRDEALCKYSHVIDDEQAVKDFEELWIDLLQEKLSIICLTKNSKGQTQLVGGNIMGIAYKGQKSDISPGKNKIYKKVISLLEYVTHLKDDIIYTELGVNEYLTAMGLYVLPEFRGQGIATEIVIARRTLSLAVGLKGSGTIFSSTASQKVAAAAGFKNLSTVAYEDLEKENPDFAFPGITKDNKYIKYMYIKYD